MYRGNLQKIKFRKSDRLRGLLTETLPYEVPLLFSNEGYYWCLKRGLVEKLASIFQFPLFAIKEPTIPYIYKIKKNAFEFRQLAIMHPDYQRQFAEFYADYDFLIAGLCQRSAYTLRAPFKIASHYIEKKQAKTKTDIKNKSVESEEQNDSLTVHTASSYFVYRRYGLIHKFYESREFHELEKKFRFLLRLDITQCFNHIYTHTIAWAIKSKKFAKENKGQSFDADFDRLMQYSNYAETNGILIGPEISRIFAELILQRIDLQVQLSLERKNLYEGKEYSVRRYVDDYFIFSNDRNIQDLIARLFSDHLLEYKLHLNNSKTTFYQRPFLTGESVAKAAVGDVVSRLFVANTKIKEIEKESIEVGENGAKVCKSGKRYTEIKYIQDISKTANTYIRYIKQAVTDNNVTYEAISGYFFGTVKRKLQGCLKYMEFSHADEKYLNRACRFLAVLLEVIFFVYAVNPRVRQTYQTSEVIILISKVLNNAPSDIRENLTKKIVDEVTNIIEHNCILQTEDNIELLNLLIALRSLGTEYLYSESFLMRLFCMPNQAEKVEFDRNYFGYFQIMTLFHYIENDTQYAHLSQGISEFVEELFTNDEAWYQKAELTCLFLDYLRCPYVDEIRKVSLAKICLRHISNHNINNKARNLISLIQKGDWFFSWNKEINLSEILLRKELRTAY